MAQIKSERWSQWPGRLVGPNGIDRINLDGDKYALRFFTGGPKTAYLVSGVEPRIVAQLRTSREPFSNPIIGL